MASSAAGGRAGFRPRQWSYGRPPTPRTTAPWSTHVDRARRPTATPLYPVVQDHLATFQAVARDEDPTGRGVCPTFNARRMAEIAVHLTDRVFPWLPISQWALSVPKRLRPFLHHGPTVAGGVLHVFLCAIRSTLCSASPGAPEMIYRKCPSVVRWIAVHPVGGHAVVEGTDARLGT